MEKYKEFCDEHVEMVRRLLDAERERTNGK